MKGLRAQPTIRTKSHSYYDFQGLDISRSEIALDTGKKQYLSRCNNAYCDAGGQIIREPAAIYLGGDHWVSHIQFYNADTLTWGEQRGDGVTLVSNLKHEAVNAFAAGSIMSSTVFGGIMYYASYGQPMKRYDGAIWGPILRSTISDTPPAFILTCNRRMLAAGFQTVPTQVFLSRVDNGEIWPNDEPKDSEEVTRAGFVDIRNYLRSGDVITGLGMFETNKAIFFTSTQPLIFQIDPNIERVQLVSELSATAGCISHNSIVNAGKDVLFCSKGGVFSIRRAQFQSISVYSHPMSEEVNLLYRTLVNNTPNTQMIDASWDQDTGRYHIYFPDRSGNYTRMSMLIRDSADEVQTKWSTATMLQATCSDELSGRHVMGTKQGVYESLDVGQVNELSVPVEMDVLSPILWTGGMHTKKHGHSYSVMMDGEGLVEFSFYDEENRLIQQDTVNLSIDEPGDTQIYSPLAKQYERPLEKHWIGLQVRIKTKGNGLVRLAGFTLNIRE